MFEPEDWVGAASPVVVEVDPVLDGGESDEEDELGGGEAGAREAFSTKPPAVCVDVGFADRTAPSRQRPPAWSKNLHQKREERSWLMGETTEARRETDLP